MTGRLIDADKAWNDAYKINTESSRIDAVRRFLYEQPAVDAEPVRHGTWILNARFPGGLEWRKCSECGREISVTKDEVLSEKYPYCHCGAKMSKGGDE